MKKPAFYKDLVGAVGIELKTTLKARKLLIPLNAKNVKNSEVAEVRYTRGTRGIGEICLWRLTGFGRVVDDCILSPIAIRNAGNFDGGRKGLNSLCCRCGEHSTQ